MAKQKKSATVLVEVPISPPLESDFLIHMDAKLRGEHSSTLRRIQKELNERHVRLRNGMHVETHADALRYVLEMIADGEGVSAA